MNGSVLTFGILGPVEISAGDRAVAVTSAKQQALLGAGLLQANAVVPTTRLVDAIWGDEPPHTAPDLVQTYVSTLRRQIGQPGASCIVTRPPGYLFRVPPGALDLHDFERLTAEADRATAGGDHESATRSLEEALRRWRGPALAGLDSPVFRAAATRLEELRLVAIERRFQAASHLGAPRWLVAELSAFVAEYPLRECTRGLLMQVLSRLGRQAEALQVYQRGYAVLRGQLGVEPGPHLRRIHQAVLAGDPAPDRSGDRIDAGGFPPRNAGREVGQPHQIPPPTRLVGREPDERALAAALARAADAPGPLLVTVDGPAGTGKTALALAVAHRVRDAFPDGQLFVPVRSISPGPTPVHTALAMLLRSIGGTDVAIPQSTDDRAALLRTLLAGRRVLVLLDDVWQAAQVRPFLGAHPGCAWLVTGRPAFADLDADLRISLGPLDQRQSLALLGRTAGSARVAAEAGAAADIVSACEGLPLAVRAAAARLVARPAARLAALAERLLDLRRRLDHLSFGDLDVRASIAGGYRRLGRPERTALRRLGAAADTDLTLNRVAQLLGTSPEAADRVAERLADARLLDHRCGTPGDQPLYRMSTLVRLYAGEQEDDRASRDSAG